MRRRSIWGQTVSDPVVSVVIPACRAAHTISRPVDSLLAQTRLPDEILVIDDGSPDDLEAALSVYGDRVMLVRKSNGGAASARNLGIERSRGELIAFLGADDYWEPWKLKRQLEILRTHPEVTLVAGRYYSHTTRWRAHRTVSRCGAPASGMRSGRRRRRGVCDRNEGLDNDRPGPPFGPW